MRALARVRTVRLCAFVPPRAPASLRHGLTLGTEEAAHTAALFGVAMTCEVAQHDDWVSTDGALAGALGTRADGVVSAVPGAAGVRLVAAAAARGLVVLDVAPPDPTPRSSPAGPRRVFHVYPAHVAATASPATALWHHTLHRYGARQLNERYERRFRTTMDSSAWAGWFAVKALAETLLRQPAGDASGEAVVSAIARGQFDGHKGQPLSFEPATGVLRQPVYEIGRDVDGREVVLHELAPERARREP